MTLTSPSDVWFGTDESPPADGNLLVLNYHHNGESHWCSPEQVRERLVEIRTVKPKAERPARLAAMGVIPFGPWWKKNAKAWSEYEAIHVKAWSEYEAIRAKAWSEGEAICFKAWSEGETICFKAWSEYEAILAKAGSEYVAAWDKYKAILAKAGSEYEATRDKAGSKLLRKFPKPIPVLEWEAGTK